MKDRPLHILADIDRPTVRDALEAALPLEGWSYPDELEWLFTQAAKVRDVVEIGVWKGRTTAALAMGARRVFACDHWCGSADELEAAHASMKSADGRAKCFRDAMANLSPFVARGRVVVVHADHSQVADIVGAMVGFGSCGFAFVDGAHNKEAAARDIASATRLVNSGGIISGHDITWPGVREAVDEIFGGQFLRGPGSIWYAPRQFARTI